MVLRGLAAQDSLEGLPELRTEDGVNDGVESRVKVSQPQEERNKVRIEIPVLEECHDQSKDEEG